MVASLQAAGIITIVSSPPAARQLREQLRQTFRWRGDRTDAQSFADMTGWWRDAAVLAAVGPALASLFEVEQPTVVLGPESRGSLLGGLVARALGIGFVEVRKSQTPLADSDAWLQRTTPPDYQDRHLRLGVRRDLLPSDDRVLMVDDWIQTGGQALAVQALVEATGSAWLGAAVIVDGLTDSGLRRRLSVRSLLHVRDL